MVLVCISLGNINPARVIAKGIYLFFIILPTIVKSQPVIEWQECFGTSIGDYFNDAIATNDNGFLAAAYFEGTDGDATPDNLILHPIIIMKFDSSLTIEWRKEFGGTTGYNNTVKILSLADGYLFGAFSSASDGDFVGNHGGRDFALLRTDLDGNKIWAKCYGGPGDDFIKSVMLTDDNSYLITGSSFFAGGDIPSHYGDGSFSDAVIMKVDSLGEVIWVNNLGGSYGDGPIGDPVLVDSGIYQVHIYSSSNDFDLEVADPDIGDLKRWIINLNSSGGIIKQNFISSETDLTRFDGKTFATDAGTIVIGAGNAESTLFPAPESHEGLEGAMAIFDSNLLLTELRQWGGSLDDVFYIYTFDEIGNYYFIGTSNSMDGDLPNNFNNGTNEDYWLMKTDSLLNKIWSINFGGSFEGGDLAGGTFLGNMIYKNNHVYVFTTCMVADAIPDHDIQCGHPSSVPGFNFSDAWIVDIKLPQNVLDSINESILQLYPNPSGYTIQLSNHESRTVGYIGTWNMLGQSIVVEFSEDWKANISNLPAGAYVTRFDDAGDMVSLEWIKY